MYCKRDKPLIFNPVKIIAKNGKENINLPPIANNVAKNIEIIKAVFFKYCAIFFELALAKAFSEK